MAEELNGKEMCPSGAHNPAWPTSTNGGAGWGGAILQMDAVAQFIPPGKLC